MSVTKKQIEIKPAIPAVTEERFVLELNREEAEFLLRLTGRMRITELPERWGGHSVVCTWDQLYKAIGTPKTQFGERMYGVTRGV